MDHAPGQGCVPVFNSYMDAQDLQDGFDDWYGSCGIGFLQVTGGWYLQVIGGWLVDFDQVPGSDQPHGRG